MKNLIFLLICTLTLTAYSCKKMDIKPIIADTKIATSAKYPGVLSALTNRLVNITPLDHQDCLNTDNGPGADKGIFIAKIYGYFLMLGDDTPTDTVVAISYHVRCTSKPVKTDYVDVTYKGVTHTFWQDCTTTWDGETLPADTATTQKPAYNWYNGSKTAHK